MEWTADVYRATTLMDQAPLVIDEIEAGEGFLKRLDAFLPVKAACWLREAEEGERYLYVALEGLTSDKMDRAYGEVLRFAKEMKDHYLDPFRVKVIRPDDPIAKAALDIYRGYPGRIPTRFNGRVFAGVAVADVYIYPPLTSNP